VPGNFSALALAPSREVKLGAPVFTVGFPKIELEELDDELTKGAISGLTGAQDDPREFQINVGMRAGNAGGPLVDESGNVVGMVESQIEDAGSFQITPAIPQNVSYAMKSSVMTTLLESVPEVPPLLKEPNRPGTNLDDAVKETGKAIALVLVY
jgi:S1-C subfamily serine protease